MKTKSILSLTLAFLLILTASVVVFPVQANASGNFSDLPSTHWAYESVKKMQEKEIIKGYADGTFRPSQTVTYGEFIKMTITALDGKDDVAEVASPTHWASKYYKAALDRNLFSSGQIAEKSLNLSIPRYDMALIAANAVKAGEVNDKNKIMEKLTDIDKDTQNSYQVMQAYCEGLITGYPGGEFRPLGTLSRAEASAVIYRIIDKSARIIPERISSVPSKPKEDITQTTNKYDSDGTPSLGTTWEDMWGTYKIVKTRDTITNWDEYLTAWEEDGGGYWLNWTEKMKLYTTEVPYEIEVDWERGTQLAKDFPDRYEGPFTTVKFPFNCYMAFLVKDNKIIHRVGKLYTDFGTGGCIVMLYDLPNTYDYILFVDPGDIAGMNHKENTEYKISEVFYKNSSVPWIFANPFK